MINIIAKLQIYYDNNYVCVFCFSNFVPALFNQGLQPCEPYD